jgi:NarL family two-component system response regulator LiaR
MHAIAIIDDHPLVINGIGAWLRTAGRFSIAGTAGTLESARSLLERLDPLPEIIIIDVSLGKEDGLAFIPVLEDICVNKNVPIPGVLVCSMYDDPFLVQRAMDSGARAFVAKTAEPGEIIIAIDAILAGNTYVNPKYRVEENLAFTDLTRREIEIASLIKQSLSTRQIAGRLGISIRTAENHIAHIYSKLNANSRSELFDL